MKSDHYRLKKRDLYLNKLIAFQDTEPVKVITGIRRCGKSSLMKLMAEHLKKQGKTDAQMIFMNFESMAYRGWDSVKLYNHVKERVLSDQRMYLFFDEIQHVREWQDAINSFRVDFDCDIYITGSNAYLLSSEIATYLAGRFVEIKMLPLSFKEFLYFHGYSVKAYQTPANTIKKRILDANGELYELEDLFDAYMKYGGMPGIADVGLEQDHVLTLLDGVYSTVVVRDILEREKRRGQRQITDIELLRKIILFMADNIGNNVSLNGIGNKLVSEKLLEDRRKKGSPAVQTIQAYVNALLESYVFYEIKRFDIKGKEYLKTLGKYYIVDLGLKNFLLGYRGIDSGHALENVVFFELLRRGYDVAIGKVGTKEVDFIATKADEKKYIQVTERMGSDETKERELSSLRMVPDNHEKLVIMLNPPAMKTEDGIQLISMFDFLLEE